MGKELKKFLVHYGNNYYDLTEFTKKHPGGIDTLKNLENNPYLSFRTITPKHSDAAIYLMQEYKVKNEDINDQKEFHNNNNINCDNIEENLDESMEHIVDWSKPMLQQISTITHYNEWVHKPVDRPLILFGPWYLEICTKTPWWVIPIFWIPNIIYLIYSEAFSTLHKNLHTSTIALYFIFGIFLWTFVEYFLHRFVFHMKPTNSYLCTFHFLIHGLHHKVPFDMYRLVFPPIPAVILSLIFYIPITMIFEYPKIVMSGGLFGYICYDLMHYYLHYGNPNIWHFYQMKRYHYQHHFAHQNIGFGISSPLWDYVFNTRIYLPCKCRLLFKMLCTTKKKLRN